MAGRHRVLHGGGTATALGWSSTAGLVIVLLLVGQASLVFVRPPS